MTRKTLADLAHGEPQFATDAAGLLYDAAVRAAIAETASGSDTEPFEALAALRLAAKRAHDNMRRWAEGHGLSESRLRLLMMLYHSPGRRRALGELAEPLDVVPRTVTDLIDLLERDGLLQRLPDPEDRRSVHAQLTESGVRQVEALKRDAFERQLSLFAGFSRGELAQLRHLCLSLVQRWSQLPG